MKRNELIDHKLYCMAVMNQIDKILPTQEEVDELLNDDEVIELTAEEILQQVFDRR